MYLYLKSMERNLAQRLGAPFLQIPLSPVPRRPIPWPARDSSLVVGPPATGARLPHCLIAPQSGSLQTSL
jgi:hypothetical protein